jgi:hypothetical protein
MKHEVSVEKIIVEHHHYTHTGPYFTPEEWEQIRKDMIRTYSVPFAEAVAKEAEMLRRFSSGGSCSDTGGHQ